jgi:hypothetical protein
MPRRSPKRQASPAQPPPQHEGTDYTGVAASHRVLNLNLGVIKYGTNDKTHAAAIVFSLLILVAIVSLTLLGAPLEHREWLDEIIRWLEGAFLVALGIALGRAIPEAK